MQKKLILLLCFIIGIASNVWSQHKQSWQSLSVYGFRLSADLQESAKVEAYIQYMGQPLVSKVRRTGSGNLKIEKKFTRLLHPSANIGNLNLPFLLPKSAYYWVLDIDMQIEMVQFPDRYKIVLKTKDLDILKKYSLPATFDFVPDNFLNVAYLQNKTEKQRNELITQKSWFLSVQTVTEPTIPLSQIRDTILVYSQRKSIPKGILLVLPQAAEAVHATTEFTINGYCYKNELFLPLPVNKKIGKSHPDECNSPFTDLNGTVCAATGCITGMGSGKCMGMFNSALAVKYLINIQIEP